MTAILLDGCKSKNGNIARDKIDQLDLKRGELVACGPPDKQFGSVNVDLICSHKTKSDFALGVSLLHSFEYEEAEKVFAKIIDQEPDCPMGYWGIAMSNYHPLWTPPTQAELEKGSKAISIAQSLPVKSRRERAYIDAIAGFFKDWEKLNHHMRSIRFRDGMQKVHEEFPSDTEATIFYALSLDAAADPTDTSFAQQRKAGAILESLYPSQPNHPGIIHYIIHSYDYPGIASLALPAARKYDSIAPASAHAQHMPSHIFTRLGLWTESIQSNIASTESAKCYAETAGIKGHWDEELHGMDYLVYAYLQVGMNKLAREQWDYLKTIREVYPVNFKDAYAFAAIPARYTIENKRWNDAANLTLAPANFPWNKFPWQKAIFHFAKLIGSVHTGRLDNAHSELSALKTIRDTLLSQKDSYKANQVAIQIKASEAWIKFGERKIEDALTLIYAAADMEDKTEKHPVTPGEVIPARELLGDMLLDLRQYEQALKAYEADLKTHPYRFNALFGAGIAALKAGDKKKAASYFLQITTIAPNAERTELQTAKEFLKKSN